jgi:DMSO reductase anchor subunit
VATLAGFVVPLALLVATAGRQDWLATTAAIAAAVVMMVGIAVERWLFFAEAKHTVALYYGR